MEEKNSKKGTLPGVCQYNAFRHHLGLNDLCGYTVNKYPES